MLSAIISPNESDYKKDRVDVIKNVIFLNFSILMFYFEY